MLHSSGFVKLLLVLVPTSLSLFAMEGYGTQMNLVYSRTILVKNEEDLHLAVTQNQTRIVFSPDLTLTMTRPVLLQRVNNILIDGPVTLTMFGIYIEHSQNVIIHNIRILNASIYGILVYDSLNVAVHHCTILDASRTSIEKGKCIDITEGSRNVTVSYSILGYTTPIEQLIKFKGMLVANFNLPPVTNFSLHHNVFYCNYQRNPQISTEGLVDLRFNIVFNYTEYGTRIREGAYGNLVGNWYIGGKKDPLVLVNTRGKVYSIRNKWKYMGTQDRLIEDVVDHQAFQCPPISEGSWINTAQIAGSLSKFKEQQRILNDILPFFKAEFREEKE